MYCTFSSEHYRRSLLVHGGLEIECQVLIETRATMLQARLTIHYLDLVSDLYTEPTEDRTVGNPFNFVMSRNKSQTTLYTKLCQNLFEIALFYDFFYGEKTFAF